MNPFEKIRECRDSDAHPRSKGIIVGFDTTGSMRHFPKIFATESLPKLMGLLVQKNFCEDPAVLFSAFNDGTTSAHPVQVGQFESGLEMDDDLTRLPLQGGGGGSMEESSEMLIYWAGHKTKMDCMEKRNQKGYLFILTDEKPYNTISARQVLETIGDKLQGDMKTEEAVAKARESFQVFVVLAETGSYQGPQGAAIRKRWIELLGEEFVLTLQDAAGGAELIAATVGLYEGALDASNLKSDLAAAGVSDAVADSVSTSLTVATRNSGGMTKASSSSNLPAPSKKGGVTRL